jgi:hypothetical protein
MPVSKYATSLEVASTVSPVTVERMTSSLSKSAEVEMLLPVRVGDVATLAPDGTSHRNSCAAL